MKNILFTIAQNRFVYLFRICFVYYTIKEKVIIIFISQKYIRRNILTLGPLLGSSMEFISLNRFVMVIDPIVSVTIFNASQSKRATQLLFIKM